MKNKGLHQYRLEQNPNEEVFAKTWEERNISKITKNIDGRSTLDFLLAINSNEPNGEVTSRDRKVAATVIQWLGSPVGQGFIQECQEIINQNNKSCNHPSDKLYESTVCGECGEVL
jgi:hypothetical protein